MTLNQMMLVLPDLPQAVANLAYQHAVVGNWARFRDYLRVNGVESITMRRGEFDAARFGHSPNLVTAQEVAAEVAQGFLNLACMECAASIQDALQHRGMPGRILDLDTGNAQGMYGHIWSDRQRGAGGHPGLIRVNLEIAACLPPENHGRNRPV
jgi:hypothetical protein